MMFKNVFFLAIIATSTIGLSACGSMGNNKNGEMTGAIVGGSSHPGTSLLGALIGSHS
jgi:hypothetical protein